MVLIYVSVQTDENGVDEFERTLREVVDDARKTTGCVRYEWYRAPEESQRYMIYGEFATKENFEKYLNSAVVKRIGAELMPLLVAPPAFKHYEATLFEGS